MSQSPNNNLYCNENMEHTNTFMPKSQQKDKNAPYKSRKYKNIWLEAPLKLMLNLAKEHLPSIEMSGDRRIENERKLWNYIKQKLDAAGYSFTATQIEGKYRYIEQNYKNTNSLDLNQLAGSAGNEIKETEIGDIAEPQRELQNNIQKAQPRSSKKMQETDIKYAEIFDLLESWGLSDLKAKFKANYIVLQALEYLTEADIIELIPKIGQRAIFRARLNQWRQQKASTNIIVPEPKKIKLEPDIEIKSPSPQPQQLQQQISPPQAMVQQILQQPQHQKNVIHKIYGNLKKITPKPKAKKDIKKTNNTNSAQTPNMQSRVQQFIIGSLPPTTSTSATPTGTGVCRLPSPPSITAASGTRKMANSSPYNLPPHIECRRFQGIKPRHLTSPQIHTQVSNHVHNAVPNIYSPAPVLNHTPVSSRIINSDNLSNVNGMSRVPQLQGTAPTFSADLTPFATSIIRVETNCETQYPSPGDPSFGNPVTKFKRTTIIQKLTPDKKTTPEQTNIAKPIIMPKPIETLQNPQVVARFPELERSPEVPKPKTLLILKEEPIEITEDDEDTLSTTHCDEYDNKQTNPDTPQPVMEEFESGADPEHETIPIVEAELEPESNPEVEEFTLADNVTELPELIKDEVLDSDSRSEHDGSDNNNGKELSVKNGHNNQESQNENNSRNTQATKEDITRLDIRNVLMSSKVGRRVIKRYVAEEMLDEGTRRLLVEVVAQYCFDNKIHITPTYCKDIAEEIIEIFPNERMEEYWVRKGRKLRPPIYNKYHCIRRDFLRRKALADAHPTNKKESEKKVSSLAQENDYDDDDNVIIS